MQNIASQYISHEAMMFRRVGAIKVVKTSYSAIAKLATSSMSACNAENGVLFPTILVNKNPSMADEAVKIMAKGLASHQEVTFHASTTLPSGAGFESYSHYSANKQGCVVLNQHASLGGMYAGVEPMGLFSYMVPSPRNKRKHERFILKDPTRPFVVTLRLFDSFIHSLEDIDDVAHKNITEISLTRWYMRPGSRRIEVRHGRVQGTLFLPPGKGPFPGLISISGGYPGAMEHKASLLASHGFATLALMFFGVEGLPDNYWDVDLTYFEEAAKFLINHPSVDGKPGLGVVANCFGSSIATAMAGCLPSGLIRCMVSISGPFFAFGRFQYKDRVWESPQNLHMEEREFPDGSAKCKFCYGGQPEDFLEDFSKSLFNFEKRRETSYLFIVGGKDECIDMFPSSEHAEKLLQSEGHDDFSMLRYPAAGHLIESAYSPHAKIAWTLGACLFCGGEQPDHVKAQEDSWQRIIDFVKKRLVITKSKV